MCTLSDTTSYLLCILYIMQNHCVSCLGFNAALLTGGSDGTQTSMKLTPSVVYPNNCMVPRTATVTFLTQEVPPRVASSGGWDDDHGNWRERSKKCLILASGNWSVSLIDNLPEKRMNSASARLDEGVFLLGGRYSYQPAPEAGCPDQSCL